MHSGGNRRVLVGTQRRSRAAGILDAGYSILDVGSSLLVAEYREAQGAGLKAHGTEAGKENGVIPNSDLRFRTIDISYETKFIPTAEVGRVSVTAEVGRHPSSHKLRRAKRRPTLR